MLSAKRLEDSPVGRMFAFHLAYLGSIPALALIPTRSDLSTGPEVSYMHHQIWPAPLFFFFFNF